MPPAAAPTFQRPYRSVVARAYNAVGRLLRRVGLKRPLSVESMLYRANRATGLWDWGDESFRAPLERLVQSFEEEARLAPLGRTMLRYVCLHHLKARLRLQALLAERPGIQEEQIRRPIFVVGLPRTGTTLLHNLLCQDTRGRPLLLWESLEPVPLASSVPGKEDPRIKKARQFVTLTTRYGAPELPAVHPMQAECPEECTYLLFSTFRTPAYALLGDVPGYLDWLRGRDGQDQRACYQEHRRFLQLLQWGRPGWHWVLKSPAHGWGLSALLDTFPDACVIQTHRDMTKVVPSYCSLVALTRGMYSDQVDCRELGKEIHFLHRDLLVPIMEARAAHPGRVFDLHYRDLLEDPVAAVRSIYRHFDLEMDEAMEKRMRHWASRNPAARHGPHRYSLDQFGLSKADVDGLFADYQQHHGVPAEAAQAR